MMRIKEYTVIFLFLLLVCTPYLVWPVLGKYVDTKNYEKRKLAKMPQFTFATIKDFPSQYEKYINDNLPFRNQMIRLNTIIDYFVFHCSTSDRVVVGEKGWLFYSRKTDGDPIACYKGTNLLTEKELLKIKSNMITTRNNLAKLGIDFIVFIAPNKERIYSRYMPYYYGPPAENYRARQIVDFLRKHTDIKIVFPVEELATAAEELGEDIILYYKTDTHWNNLGAYIGTRELLKALGIELPPYTDNSISITESNRPGGDLANMLNLATMIEHGKAYTPTGYDTHNFMNKKKDFRTEYIYRAKGADSRKIFISRDSFCTAMGDIIGSQFNESLMVYRGFYNHDMVKKQRPDIFVLELVERSAGTMLGFVYQ